MINFILGYDFEHVRSGKDYGSPLDILKPIKLFYFQQFQEFIQVIIVLWENFMLMHMQLLNHYLF